MFPWLSFCFYFHEMPFSIHFLSVCVSLDVKWVSCMQQHTCMVDPLSLLLCLHLLMRFFFSFGNFLFLVVAFSFPLKKDPLIFLIIPVQCWTLLAFAFLWNSVSISNVNDSLFENNIIGFRSVFPFQTFVYIVPLSSRLQNFCCKVS